MNWNNENFIKMIISMIAAMASNRVIGKNNALPWSLPADYEYFKNKVRESSVIMGRLSYEAEDGFLTNKTNVILSRQDSLELSPNCIQAKSLEEAFEILKDEEEIFILGGAKIYSMALPYAHRLFLTLVDAEIEGDAYFPEVNWSNWKLTWKEAHQANTNNQHPYTFTLYKRISST